MKKTVNIIGISPKQNASACLLQDGKIVAIGEEERFNRIKTGGGNFPISSIEYVMKEGGICLSDVDCFAVAWDCKKYPKFIENFRDKNFKNRTKIDKLIDQTKTATWTPEYIKFKLQTGLRMRGLTGNIPKILYVPHHLCHAARYRQRNLYAKGDKLTKFVRMVLFSFDRIFRI